MASKSGFDGGKAFIAVCIATFICPPLGLAGAYVLGCILLGCLLVVFIHCIDSIGSPTKKRSAPPKAPRFYRELSKDKAPRYCHKIVYYGGHPYLGSGTMVFNMWSDNDYINMLHVTGCGKKVEIPLSSIETYHRIKDTGKGRTSIKYKDGYNINTLILEASAYDLVDLWINNARTNSDTGDNVKNKQRYVNNQVVTEQTLFHKSHFEDSKTLVSVGDSINGETFTLEESFDPYVSIQCPCCRSLYKIKKDRIISNVKSARCKTCGKVFGLATAMIDEESESLRLQQRANDDGGNLEHRQLSRSETSIVCCPNCGQQRHPSFIHTSECPKCGFK